MIKNRSSIFILNFSFVLMLIMLVNGRSILGVSVFGFRVGEYLTGFAAVLLFLVLFKFKYLSKNMDNKIVISYIFLFFYFLISNFVNNVSFLNLYAYKSSVFIWYMSFLFLGFLIFKNFKISEVYFIFGYAGLLFQYIFNVIYYPDIFEEFFNKYSDKTQFLKGSEIAIFFIVVTFFSLRLSKKNHTLDLFILFSSIYFPLIIFKSRSAGIAVGLYIISEIFINKANFKINIKKSIVVSVVSLILFSGSSFLLIDNVPEIQETDQAIAQVFKHKYVVSNTYDTDVSFVYIYEGRLYSADGNLNWRFQLWQDILDNSIKNDEVFFGHGFNDRIPIFEEIWYSGLDGSNENSHNYLINVYIRVGLVGLFVVIYFFYKIIRFEKNNFSNIEFLRFLLPLVFISLFDGSMENPYFASIFYFFTGSFFSGIKLSKYGNSLNNKKL